MGAMVWLVLAASPFVDVDGGFISIAPVTVPHRTLEVNAPAALNRPVVVSDGDAPGTHLALTFSGTAMGELGDGGVLRYGLLTLSRPDPLTLEVQRAGDLSVQLPATASTDGARWFVQVGKTRYLITASAPLSLQSDGTHRVVGASTWLKVQLMPVSGVMPWPTFGAVAWGASMVWDEARGRLTRFGGTDDLEYVRGTFVLDDTLGWVDLGIPSPPPRLRAGMTYDRLRQRIVLFGGHADENRRLDDTWEFDGTQWTQISVTTKPPARWAHGLAYDAVAQKTVLFGGLLESDLGELDDTWTWDGTQWVQLFPLAKPSARDAFGMAWDNARQRVTIAGGWDGNQMLREAWAWDGTRWQRLADFVCPPRTSTMMAFNPLSQELVLAGGYDPRGGPRYFDSVDLFSGTSWRPGTQLPRPVFRAALASHPVHGVVLFGGKNDLLLDETLSMGAQWTVLPQGRTDEGRVAVGPDRVAGNRARWAVDGGRWSFVGWSPAPPVGAVSTGSGPLIVGNAADGGWRAWTFELQDVPAPPAGSMLGGHQRDAWAVDDGGTLLLFATSGWTPVAQVPADVRVLEREGPLSRVFYALRQQQLLAWDSSDGGARTIEGLPPLEPDVQVVSTPNRLLVVTLEGTWHARADGGWEFLGLPTTADRIAFDALLSDAGLGRYAPLKPVGARCNEGAECELGACRQGRCCNTPCASGCEVCSAAAGALRDGECTVAAIDTACVLPGCSVARCNGVSPECAPVSCLPADAGSVPPDDDAGSASIDDDAGLPSGVDAGRRPVRDAGVLPPEPEPKGCGCTAPPGPLLALLALALVRRRVRRG